MNFFKRLFLILFIIFFSVNTSFSFEKIAFVDVDYIIQNSSIGKKMLKDLNEKNKKNLSELQNKNKILKKIEKEINDKKNVISEDAFNAEVVSFRKKLQDFSNEKNKMANEFNDFKKKKLQEIFTLISPIIDKYMETNSLEILLDKKDIFIGKPTANLTKELLDKINKEIN